MNNRATRRADTRAFRQQVHRDHIVTHLVSVHTDLTPYPMLHNVAMAWRAGIASRRPYCFCCKASFAKTATPGAFLFAVPRGDTDMASVSVLCVECWRDLPLDKIEAVAAQVLRALSPDGRWLDAGR